MATATEIDPNVPKEEETFAPAPPDEEFWEKWSPHSEFALSTFGSVAIHIVVVGLFLIYIGKLLEFERSNTSPPIRAMVVGEGGLGAGDGTTGSGGGSTDSRDPLDPLDARPPIPDAQFQEVKAQVVAWSPDFKDDPEMIKVIAQSPEFDKLKKMNDDLRKKLLEGVNGTRGKGTGEGTGVTGDQGTGSTGKGSGNSTGERTLRWTLKFETTSGFNYLEQLAAMKAKIIMPQPPDWRTANLITDLLSPNGGKPIDVGGINEMHFIDDRAESVLSVAEALGLRFRPAYFIAVFPKDIEDQLAAKEIAYRNRKPTIIASTTFKILVRDGKPAITVVEQKIKGN